MGKVRKKAKVAIFSPIRSAYFDYKRNGWDIESELDTSYKQLANKLSSLNIPFDILDETVMAKHGKVSGDKFIVGECSYDFVLFSKVLTLDKISADLFETYYSNGGKMLFMEQVPEYLEGQKHAYNFKTNTTIEEIVDAQEYKINRSDTSIKSTIREINGIKFIYAVNLSNEEYEIVFDGKFNSFISLDLETLTTKPITKTIHFDGGQSYILFLSNETATNEVCKKEYEFSFNGDYLITDCSDNYLTLDTLQYSLDGVNYSKKLRYIGVFSELLKIRHNGDVYLKYTFNAKSIPKRISFLTEDMNNVWCKINGNLIELDGVSDFEKKIKKGDVSKFIVQGQNEIIIKINFYESDEVYFVLFGGDAVTEGLKNKLAYDTSIECCYLQGDFGVYAENGLVDDANQDGFYRGEDFYIADRKNRVNNMVKDGYPFFVGFVEFTKELVWDKDYCILNLNGNFAISDVFVNDIKVDKSYFATKVDITNYVNKGKNFVKVRLWSGGRNLFGPHHYKLEPPGVGPYTFERFPEWVDGVCPAETTDYSFKKFGLD